MLSESCILVYISTLVPVFFKSRENVVSSLAIHNVFPLTSVIRTFLVLLQYEQGSAFLRLLLPTAVMRRRQFVGKARLTVSYNFTGLCKIRGSRKRSTRNEDVEYDVQYATRRCVDIGSCMFAA